MLSIVLRIFTIKNPVIFHFIWIRNLSPGIKYGRDKHWLYTSSVWTQRNGCEREKKRKKKCLLLLLNNRISCSILNGANKNVKEKNPLNGCQLLHTFWLASSNSFLIDLEMWSSILFWKLSSVVKHGDGGLSRNAWFIFVYIKFLQIQISKYINFYITPKKAKNSYSTIMQKLSHTIIIN